jgi:2-methylcitrate dehydratase PrpD
MEKITRKLADFIAKTNYDSIPEEVRYEVKRRILDYFGVTLAGTTRPEGKLIRDFVLGLGGKKECTILGIREKTTIDYAALANGTTAHVVELGDWGRTSNTHGGETMGSACLAMGEREGVDGKRFITAWVLGNEAAQRVGNASHPALRERGFHANGCVATFGAAAASAKILGLNGDRTEQALGFAGTQSAGLLTFLYEGSMSKRLHTGRANQAGVVAALLAKQGFIGPRAIIESEKGFLRAFTQWPDPGYHSEKVLQGLGDKFEIMNMNIKIHACCGYFPPGLDLIQDLQEQHKFKIEDVEKIQVRSYKLSIDGHQDTRPTTIVGATMSYPYCIAVLLMTGKVSLRDFTMGKLKDKKFMDKVEALGKRCTFVIDPAMDKLIPEKYPAAVEIELKGGMKLSASLDLPRGFYPENPVGDQELFEKFRDLASMVLSPKTVNLLQEMTMGLERVKDIRELTAVIRGGLKKEG